MIINLLYFRFHCNGTFIFVVVLQMFRIGKLTISNILLEVCEQMWQVMPPIAFFDGNRNKSTVADILTISATLYHYYSTEPRIQLQSMVHSFTINHWHLGGELNPTFFDSPTSFSQFGAIGIMNLLDKKYSVSMGRRPKAIAPVAAVMKRKNSSPPSSQSTSKRERQQSTKRFIRIKDNW